IRRSYGPSRLQGLLGRCPGRRQEAAYRAPAHQVQKSRGADAALDGGGGACARVWIAGDEGGGCSFQGGGVKVAIIGGVSQERFFSGQRDGWHVWGLNAIRPAW